MGEGRFEGESLELCIGHVKFEMLIRYPSIWVGIQLKGKIRIENIYLGVVFVGVIVNTVHRMISLRE